MRRHASFTIAPMLVLTLALVAAIVIAIAARPTSARAAAAPTAQPHLNAREKATLRLINRYRVAHQLRPLRVDARLQRAAHWMGTDLDTHPYFGHTDTLGRSPFARIRHYGYPSRATTRGENLNAGQLTARESFEAWRASPAHDRNLLNPRYRTIGIAVVVGAHGGSFGSYWVTDFG